MEFVMDAWYVAAWPHEIVAGNLFARTICNEAMILWRDRLGNVVALEDRCCHRNMPLSKGLIEAGTVRCSYHGLRFAGDGRCVEIPGQEKVPNSVRVRSFPAVERHGWVWVWPGDPALADPALIPEAQSRNKHPDWTSIGGTVHMKANYNLIHDNLLDLTHETYVHPTSLGNEAVVENPIQTTVAENMVKVSRWMLKHDPAPFWKEVLGRATGYSGLADRWQIVTFHAPCSLVLDVGVAPTNTGAPQGDRSKGVPGCNLNAITPETSQSSFLFWAFARTFQRDDKTFDEALKKRIVGVIEEDKAAIEAVQSVLNRNSDNEETLLKFDSGVVAARRIIERMIKQEQRTS